MNQKRNNSKRNSQKEGVFDALRIAVASPSQILGWSHGEITKPETINYRTQKPEKDGLFCERIFGPSKDWECYCGKYKRIRYRGIICDKCGVEVTRSIVRRERMGHIKLAAPCAHIWYIKIPCKVGLLLGLSAKDIERVVYFAAYIVSDVDEESRKNILKKLENDFLETRKKNQEEEAKALKNIKVESGQSIDKQAKSIKKDFSRKFASEEELFQSNREGISSVEKLKIISEVAYQELQNYKDFFSVKIGAEAFLDILSKTDYDKIAATLHKEIKDSVGQKKLKALRRLKLIEGFKAAGIKPEWMVTTVLPVIPPDLRPMVQLDGGRFASADLNDLYRKVINRNNRLKRLLDLGAPEVICRNEKRMLQEAVDALIDSNIKREKSAPMTAKRKLRSLSDMLKGKTGRFRQNLLGKRVDYSARSVIVVGPKLHLDQCGLPKMIALELFKPFVIGKLIADGMAHNVKNAGKMIEQGKNEVWDALEEVIDGKLVLLNRAPTLHRLGIQAFSPVLIEGKAIQIHPLVCAAFNADFDGDQMAVHLPLSAKAQEEARELILSTKNLLKPSGGEPVVEPTQDIILGCYWLTVMREKLLGEGKYFANICEVLFALETKTIELQAKIKIKINNQFLETTAGRLIFNKIVPEPIGFVNETMVNAKLKELVARIFSELGHQETVLFVDNMKDLGFKYATISGVSLAMDDFETPKGKKVIIDEAEGKVINIAQQYQQGFITESERHTKSIEVWEDAKDKISKELTAEMHPWYSLGIMVNSGARGNIGQLMQMSGMKGPVVSPTGRIIELPIKSNYKEGLSVLEYFISTHGSRKGLVDTALRTSDSGYLTRRLVDVSQDIFIASDDCSDTEGFLISMHDGVMSQEEFDAHIVGRVTAQTIANPKTGGVIITKGHLITPDKVEEIHKAKVNEVKIRSVLKCKNLRGICKKCYGLDLGQGELVKLGEAVGIIAAQSIGEPGTQLTMRTFHTGGVVGLDITQGLPRVEEVFEARAPKGQAILAEIEGIVNITERKEKKVITVVSSKIEKDDYEINDAYKIIVSNGSHIEDKEILAVTEGKRPIRVKFGGIVKKSGQKISITRDPQIKEYELPRQITLKVSNKEEVSVGHQLTEGSWNLQEAIKLTSEEVVQRYIVSEIQQIYASQGQNISDKHIETIVRQMFSRVRIDDPGDTLFIGEEIVTKALLVEKNIELKKQGKKPATSEPLVLSITKVAQTTDSFLSAASFQETTKMLIEAAVKGDIDRLRGLKENVIIGKLIPVGTGFRG